MVWILVTCIFAHLMKISKISKIDCDRFIIFLRKKNPELYKKYFNINLNFSIFQEKKIKFLINIKKISFSLGLIKFLIKFLMSNYYTSV